MIKAVFFDVANTLLEKPQLFSKMTAALQCNGHIVDEKNMRLVHKFVSEVFVFPDKTSREFYREFNTHLLYALGIVPSDELLNDLFEACTYLPWQPFTDSAALESIERPLGILSNWDNSLREKLADHFNVSFNWVLCSQDEGIKKPNPLFFQRMMNQSGLQAEEILFVGDSMKLDIHPALELGVKALLIDRHNHFPNANVARIENLEEITQWL